MALTKVSTAAIKDEAITLTKLLHGDSNSNGKFLRANNGADPTFEAITIPASINNLVEDTSPQLGGSLDVNNKNVNFGDSTGSGVNRLRLGANNELQLFHGANGINYISGEVDGADFYIRGRRDLYLQCGNNASSYRNVLYADNNGSTRLYHPASDAIRLQTQTYGINVTGSSSITAQIKMHGQPLIGRSYWGYGGNQSYTGTSIGRTDSSTASSIFMGVDVTGNAGGNFGGLGSEIVFRRDHIFTTPNAANNNFVTCMRFGRATSTEGAVAFTNGLMFGNDQADANILDDYEEGTWTPGLKGTGSNPAISYIVQRGYYSKIGSLVHVWFDIAWNSKSGGSGNFIINPLPFATGHTYYHGFGIVTHGSGLSDGGHGPRGIYANANSTSAYVIQADENYYVVLTSHLANNGHIFGGFTYRVNT